ncbi:invasion associated locus B family protein [Bradyrhizobium liaoningense]|uniref:invasion associated locus B family protein n=1 Tax=Bradyrhizobium liaoningense TaxID=43992 RepID=UPI001BA8AE7F|nr:invasion associated locus B family protein [Bradyrhizobium liaoningense]MBR0713266.1 invasion associated locus B family protein [Bradyrhizobium liaoningense]
MVDIRHCLPGLLLAAVFGVTPITGAVAREKSQVAKPAEVAARGPREAKDITYGDWQKLCFKPGGAPTLCRTSITGRFPTGQMAVRIDLIEREDSKTARLQLFVPVGMHLQHAVKLTVDQGSPHQVPYTWCLTNACIAGDVADSKLIKDMESGKALVLEVVDSNLLSLTTTLPLAQFASARKGPPAKTMQQDVDE